MLRVWKGLQLHGSFADLFLASRVGLVQRKLATQYAVAFFALAFSWPGGNDTVKLIPNGVNCLCLEVKMITL